MPTYAIWKNGVEVEMEHHRRQLKLQSRLPIHTLRQFGHGSEKNNTEPCTPRAGRDQYCSLFPTPREQKKAEPEHAAASQPDARKPKQAAADRVPVTELEVLPKTKKLKDTLAKYGPPLTVQVTRTEPPLDPRMPSVKDEMVARATRTEQSAKDDLGKHGQEIMARIARTEQSMKQRIQDMKEDIRKHGPDVLDRATARQLFERQQQDHWRYDAFETAKKGRSETEQLRVLRGRLEELISRREQENTD